MDSLRQLNRVRIYMQVLFLSDIIGTAVKNLDIKYLSKQVLGDSWSRIKFPKEMPPRKDFKLWEQDVRLLVPTIGIPDRIGPLNTGGNNIWSCRYYKYSEMLINMKGDVMDVYRPSQLPSYCNIRNRWTRLLRNEPVVLCGDICSVRYVALAVVEMVSTTKDPPPKEVPQCFLNVLQEFGCEFMWASLRLEGDDNWVEELV